MPPILDRNFQDLVVCPLCKTALKWLRNECVCNSCGHRYSRTISGVWNFIIQPPKFLRQINYEMWKQTQKDYEVWGRNLMETYEDHLADIKTVHGIHTSEFTLAGKVLDVGGHQGRLRHFLSGETSYLCADPCGTVFNGLDGNPALLNAYPCLLEPCNFLQAHAERLPLRESTFDYVHLRSVLDHFFDPYLALCEARRVLHWGGGVMIGTAVTGDQSPIREGSGIKNLLSRFRKKVRDEGLKTGLLAVAKRISGGGERDVHL